MMGPTLLGPTDLEAAVGLLGAHGRDAAVLAGGVSWMLRQARGQELPPVLISLAGIDALHGLEVADGALVIGAMTSLVAVERSSIVADRAPGLAQAIAAVGSVRIRSQATIGGNLAAGVPRYDPPPMLLALDARVRLAGSRETRELELASWSHHDRQQTPGEILVAIVVPPQAPRSAARYQSIDGASGIAFEHAAAAVRVNLGADGAIVDARVVIADMIAIPRRYEGAETRLIGAMPSPETAGDAAARAAEQSAEAGSGRDHADLVATATRRALLAAFADLVPGSVTSAAWP
jgi:carbon-monoxide dehydrogenase medium subunit